jgi:hypothetical protein
MDQRKLLVIGYWLLVTGYRLLVIGYPGLSGMIAIFLSCLGFFAYDQISPAADREKRCAPTVIGERKNEP